MGVAGPELGQQVVGGAEGSEAKGVAFAQAGDEVCGGGDDALCRSVGGECAFVPGEFGACLRGRFGRRF